MIRRVASTPASAAGASTTGASRRAAAVTSGKEIGPAPTVTDAAERVILRFDTTAGPRAMPVDSVPSGIPDRSEEADGAVEGSSGGEHPAHPVPPGDAARPGP